MLKFFFFKTNRLLFFKVVFVLTTDWEASVEFSEEFELVEDSESVDS